MTRLQQEVARKLLSLGYASEYQNETGIMNITLEGQPICHINPDDSYTYLSNDYAMDNQVEAFHEVEKMIDTTNEYITAYENAPQFEIDSFAGGVSGKLENGDIVSIIVTREKQT